MERLWSFTCFCVGCIGNIFLCSVYLIAGIIFFTIGIFSSSISILNGVCSPICFLPSLSFFRYVSDGRGTAWVAVDIGELWVKSREAESNNRAGCHGLSVKKLQGLNNCSISGKEKIFLNGSGKKIDRICVGGGVGNGTQVVSLWDIRWWNC